MPVTMYHDPRRNTSRRTLTLLREKSVAGIKALLLSKRQSVAGISCYRQRAGQGEHKPTTPSVCCAPITIRLRLERDRLTPPCPSNSHFTGTRMGAPLAFSSTTTNLAGSVLLALRPTT